MKFYLVRHGETDKNLEKVLQGRINTKLNENGIRQAETAAAHFAKLGIRFDRIWSSPLDRALQTARIIAGEQTELMTDERLLEMEYGPYEGRSFAEPDPELTRFFSDFAHEPAPEGMEQLPDIVERLGDFLTSIRSEEEGNVLIATHAIALKGALEYLAPEPDGAGWYRNVGNCSVYVTEYKDGKYSRPEEFFRLP